MIDEGQIRLWWSLFRPDNALEEIRLLGAGTVSGYFTDVETLINELRRYANHPKFSVYFILNEIHSGCYYRQQRDKLIYVAEGETTKGNHIVRRKWLLIDIDPNKYINGVKYTDVNSSNAELAAARNIARKVYDFLTGRGFPMPITTLSGNGIHLYYRIDEPNDDETEVLLKNFLGSLGQKFSTKEVGIDPGVYTSARLSKLYGTVPHKGADVADRPCRMARIEFVPPEIKLVSRELIQPIADEYEDPKEKERELKKQQKLSNQQNYGSTEFPDVSVKDFLDEHGIEYTGPNYDSDTGAMKFKLTHCPWEHEHTTESKPGHAVIYEWPSGHKDFHCFHGHCTNRDWTDVWKAYDPDLYRNAWREQFGSQQQSSVVKPPVQDVTQNVQSANVPSAQKGVEEENSERGKKWLSTGEVEMFDPSKAVVIKTGFYELDRLINLCLGEVTLISGGNSAGKSSWLNSLTVNVVDQGFSVAMWSREMPANREVFLIDYIAAGSHNIKDRNDGSGKTYLENDIKERIDKWLYGKFYLYNNNYPPKWSQLAADLMEPIRLGCKLIILDNLFSLNISDFGGTKIENQTYFIQDLCDMAKMYQIHIIIVAHPRKITGYIRKVDISGSADLTNAADNVLILHRNNDDFKKAYDECYGKKGLHARFKEYGNVMEIAKTRFEGVVDIIVGYYFDPRSKRFKNKLNEVKHYGWEDGGSRVEYDNELLSQKPLPTGSQLVDYTEPRKKENDFNEEHTDEMPF